MKGMSIEEFSNRRCCRECGIELKPFNKSLCNDCLTKELIFRNREFRKMVYEKFNSKCFYCSNSERVCLSIHHIEPSDRNRFDIDKAILLCNNCHTLLNLGKIPVMALSNGDRIIL